MLPTCQLRNSANLREPIRESFKSVFVVFKGLSFTLWLGSYPFSRLNHKVTYPRTAKVKTNITHPPTPQPTYWSPPCPFLHQPLTFKASFFFSGGPKNPEFLSSVVLTTLLFHFLVMVRIFHYESYL